MSEINASIKFRDWENLESLFETESVNRAFKRKDETCREKLVFVLTIVCFLQNLSSKDYSTIIEYIHYIQSSIEYW